MLFETSREVEKVWQGRNVLVIGGASFIGSHLVDALGQQGAKVRTVDGLSSGKLENFQQHLAESTVEFIWTELRG
jgi:nucleoside-diphosphate-sugar epimerase